MGVARSMALAPVEPLNPPLRLQPQQHLADDLKIGLRRLALLRGAVDVPEAALEAVLLEDRRAARRSTARYLFYRLICTVFGQYVWYG